MKLVRFFARLFEKRCRKGGYDWVTRNMVILDSLKKGEFDDSFLFQEQ